MRPVVPFLGVFFNKRISLKNFLEQMKEEGYQIDSSPKYISKNVFESAHRKGRIIAAGYSGLSGIEGQPEIFRYKTAILFGPRETMKLEKILKEAERLAKKHHGVLYSITNRRVITTFMRKAKLDPGAMLPSGKVATTPREKEEIIRKWNISKKAKRICRTCVYDDTIILVESGHVWEWSEIFRPRGYVPFPQSPEAPQ